MYSTGSGGGFGEIREHLALTRMVKSPRHFLIFS
jgi:hypothetical protein